MDARKITVRTDGMPVAERIPVQLSRNPSRSLSVQRDELMTTPGLLVATDGREEFEEWAEYFGTSIEWILPSSEHEFTPKAVSVEREVFYRDDAEDGEKQDESKPQRIRVTRRRVTLYGTVRNQP